MEDPFREGEFEAAVRPSKNGVNSSKIGIEWNQRIGWIDVSFEFRKNTLVWSRYKELIGRRTSYNESLQNSCEKHNFLSKSRGHSLTGGKR